MTHTENTETPAPRPVFTVPKYRAVLDWFAIDPDVAMRILVAFAQRGGKGESNTRRVLRELGKAPFANPNPEVARMYGWTLIEVWAETGSLGAATAAAYAVAVEVMDADYQGRPRRVAEVMQSYVDRYSR